MEQSKFESSEDQNVLSPEQQKIFNKAKVWFSNSGARNEQWLTANLNIDGKEVRIFLSEYVSQTN